MSVEMSKMEEMVYNELKIYEKNQDIKEYPEYNEKGDRISIHYFEKVYWGILHKYNGVRNKYDSEKGLTLTSYIYILTQDKLDDLLDSLAKKELIIWFGEHFYCETTVHFIARTSRPFYYQIKDHLHQGKFKPIPDPVIRRSSFKVKTSISRERPKILRKSVK